MKSKIDIGKDGKSITVAFSSPEYIDAERKLIHIKGAKGRKDKHLSIEVFKQSLSRQEIKLASERNRDLYSHEH